MNADDEAQDQLIPPTSTKAVQAQFLRTLTDEHLILHLTHVVAIWFKDSDILAFEELLRRFKAKSTEIETRIG